MKNLSKLLCLITLLASFSLTASDSYKERAIKKLAQEISQNPNNLHLVIRRLTEEVADVEKVIGKPLEPRLALQISGCSDLAAHPDDPGKYGKGIQYSKIEPEKAIKICRAAYQNGGKDIGLVLASLSRAYNKAEDYQNSMYYTKKAIEVGYPFGDVMMGIHYSFGNGVKKNQKTQFQWYRKAAAKGVTSAMRATSNNYVIGSGTSKNLDEAYFWALNAIEQKDGKGFYSMGRALEEKAKAGNSKTSQKTKNLLSLAKQSFEIANANGVNTEKDVYRVNKQRLPNSIHDDSILFKPKFKGRQVNGQFYRSEINGYWYTGENQLSNKGNTYLYSRTSYSNSTLSIWYKQSSNSSGSGWYVDFLYGGSNDVLEFTGISVTSKISGKTRYLNLELSDPHVQKLPATYRLTGGISFRDVQLLAQGTQVKLYYNTASKHTPTYTFALNDKEIQSNDTQQTAKIILNKMMVAAKKLNKNCCNQPDIEPLGKQYIALFKMCDDKELTLSFSKNVILQNCHQLLRNTDYSSDLISFPFKHNQTRLLKAIEREWNG